MPEQQPEMALSVEPSFVNKIGNWVNEHLPRTGRAAVAGLAMTGAVIAPGLINEAPAEAQTPGITTAKDCSGVVSETNGTWALITENPTAYKVWLDFRTKYTDGSEQTTPIGVNPNSRTRVPTYLFPAGPNPNPEDAEVSATVTRVTDDKYNPIDDKAQWPAAPENLVLSCFDNRPATTVAPTTTTTKSPETTTSTVAAPTTTSAPTAPAITASPTTTTTAAVRTEAAVVPETVVPTTITEATTTSAVSSTSEVVASTDNADAAPVKEKEIIVGEQAPIRSEKRDEDGSRLGVLAVLSMLIAGTGGAAGVLTRRILKAKASGNPRHA